MADIRRVAERHAFLAACAAKAMIPHGFHSTSIRDFAAAAGWSMGQLYRYISSKQDILFLVGRHVCDALWDQLYSSSPGKTHGESLTNAARSLFDAVAAIPEEVAVIYREGRSMKEAHRRIMTEAELSAQAYLASIIRDGIAAREFAPWIEPDLAAQNIILLAHMWALKSWVAIYGKTFEQYREEQLSYILGSLVRCPEAVRVAQGVPLRKPFEQA